MVKTRLFSLAVLCPALLVVLLAGCSAAVAARSEILEIKEGVPGKFVSLAASGANLFALFSDRESTTLKTLQVPIGPHLPAQAPAATVLDKIDVTPPLSATFGEHALAVIGTTVEVLYAARHNEDRGVLKLAYRDIDAPQWKLDIVDPPGDPVAVLPRSGSSFALYWAAGSLLSRVFPSDNAAVALSAPFQLQGRASVFSSNAFTVFDGASRAMMEVSVGPEGVTTRQIPDASAVSSSLLTPDGRLAVLTWDARSRRLLLLEGRQGREDFSRTTVTLCDGTVTVALLPPHRRAGFLFLFDEVRHSGSGSTEYQLSLLSPGAVLGGLGSRYQKEAVLSGQLPIESFAALETTDAIYILALQGTLKLIRLGFPQ
ncbi:MAG TPA: hypothetical protein VMM82_13775 [Spirochaetia bacterium]|nr:hypothetical protein [Spirochaetia bacterium]